WIPVADGDRREDPAPCSASVGPLPLARRAVTNCRPAPERRRGAGYWRTAWSIAGDDQPRLARNCPARSRNGRGKYAPYVAQKQAEMRGRRPKRSKFDNVELAQFVEGKLVVRWSPEQISDGLAGLYPDRAEMRVSHETIYQALLVQGRGHLRADLHKHL